MASTLGAASAGAALVSAFFGSGVGAGSALAASFLGASGAGAAGGLGAGFLFFTEGRLCPGVDVVLETANFEELVKQADLVLTGEGCTDYQTAYGKAPVGVSSLAKAYGVPCICLSGGLGEGCSAVREKGIDALSSTAPGPLSLEECMERGADLIEEAAERVCRLLAVGMNLKNR